MSQKKEKPGTAPTVSGPEVSDTVADEISCMLGSCKKRLELVIEALEVIESKKSTSVKISDVIADMEQIIQGRRNGDSKGGANAG